jgi:signal transduction histidine kinase
MKPLLWCSLSFAFLLCSVQANTLEETIARRFTKGYRLNEARLATLEKELETLPHPYLREPTGTGGFLSSRKEVSNDRVYLNFAWESPVELDAVALFPLRLFMDGVYSDNLYWPNSITIGIKRNGKDKILAQRLHSQSTVQQSLPEFIPFDPVTTDNLFIRCTNLRQHPQLKWYAAGFSEICIFSDNANLAPRARVVTNGSRDGYHVLAKQYLTDAQTPLGLPQLAGRKKNYPFLKRINFGDKVLAQPYVLTFTYPEAQPIDAVRIDPAIQHSYGQSFPERFTIELLDKKENVLCSDTTYKTFPMRKPGLNPYVACFPETTASAVRLTVFEASQPVPQADLAIALSEITPLFQGEALPRPAKIKERIRDINSELKTEASHTITEIDLLAACDGLTQSGRILSQREWAEGLSRRQQLLAEQLTLQSSRKHTLAIVQKFLVRGSMALLILGIGSAVLIVRRNRKRTRKEMRLARAKIASDLHDDVGSNLGAIILHVEKLQETQPKPTEYDRLHSILRLTRESVFGLREVLSTSAPEVGRTQNIVAYMQELATLILGKTDHTFSAEPSLSEMLLDHRLRKGILLFYKEALYNAKRHADCDRVEISLQPDKGVIVLTIQDNGAGIDEKTLAKKQTLRTLKQRAEWLHAHLDITSSIGTGTKLTLSIPVSF